MQQTFTAKWDDLSNWVNGLHSAVSTTIEERLAPIGSQAVALIVLCSAPDAGDEPLEYSCLIAADGWLHELSASVAGSVVNLNSYPLRQLAQVSIRTERRTAAAAPPGTLYAASITLENGKTFEWEDVVESHASRRRLETAKSAIRFVEALQATARDNAH
jgi:hypothetical protein